MPIATRAQYLQILERAKKEHYALPAINVANLEMANAALQAFAEARSDGIIQVSIGGAKHASGGVNAVLGAQTLAEHVHRMAERYNVCIILHTDHCAPEHLDSFVLPLLELSKQRIDHGMLPLFQSHMFDGSELPLAENLKKSRELVERCEPLGILLELEIGVVGGEEDGKNTENVERQKLYTTPEDMVAVWEALQGHTYLLAATFGNVHGVYKPGSVKLKPEILRDGQRAVQERFGSHASHYLVFHGGSGSSVEDIHATLDYGVIKMNIDTDNQYAFSRVLADFFFKNYDSVLKIDGEVGNKKFYDPRVYLSKGVENMRKNIVSYCQILRSQGKSILH